MNKEEKQEIEKKSLMYISIWITVLGCIIFKPTWIVLIIFPFIWFVLECTIFIIKKIGDEK